MKIIDAISDFLNGLGIVLVRFSKQVVNLSIRAVLLFLPIIVLLSLITGRTEGDTEGLLIFSTGLFQFFYFILFGESIFEDTISNALNHIFCDSLKSAYNVFAKGIKLLVEIGKENKL